MMPPRAPPARARLIRRAPLSERVLAYLNPWDWLIWAAEELNSNDWDDFTKQWATSIGLLANLVYIIARSNSSGSGTGAADDVFGDSYARSGSGWLIWLATFLSHGLMSLAFLNAAYTLLRKRHYRLFEHSVDIAPPTPSARRVRVESSPLSFSSSPLRHIKNAIASAIFSDSSAASRAHPDPSRDVWEVAVWDPSPLCLALFTLFSPGHVLLYNIFLPLQPLDPRPSVTVFTTILLAALMSAQLAFMRSLFLAQARDNNFINRQVHAEYDAKFVKPTLNCAVRDVGTQLSFTSTGTPVSGDRHRGTPEVQTYTPTTYVNRGFQVHPNENYAALYSPDATSLQQQQQLGRTSSDSILATPIAAAAAARAHRPAPRLSSDFSSPPIFPARGGNRLPGRSQSSQQLGGGDLASGGYAFAQSPLKQATAANARARASAAGEDRGLQPGRRRQQANGRF